MRNLLLTIVVCTLQPLLAWACGTIDSRYERYVSAQTDDERFIELKFMSCESIVKTYQFAPEQRRKILHLIEDALIHGEQMAKMRDTSGYQWKSMYYKDLAVKLYVQYQQYHKPAIKRQSEISWLIREAYGLETLRISDLAEALPNNHWLRKDAELGQANEDYSKILRKHVKALIGR